MSKEGARRHLVETVKVVHFGGDFMDRASSMYKLPLMQYIEFLDNDW